MAFYGEGQVNGSGAGYLTADPLMVRVSNRGARVHGSRYMYFQVYAGTPVIRTKAAQGPVTTLGSAAAGPAFV